MTSPFEDKLISRVKSMADKLDRNSMKNEITPTDEFNGALIGSQCLGSVGRKDAGKATATSYPGTTQTRGIRPEGKGSLILSGHTRKSRRFFL